MAKDKKGMTDEEFDKIAEDYLMEKQPTKELLKTMFKVHKAWNVQV